MYRTVSLVVFICVIAASLASPARHTNCGDVETKCQISNVDITPCAKPDRCLFKIGKGRNASIAFDFTPEFSATELENMLTTNLNGNDVSLAGFEENACKLTPCPVEAGKKQTLRYDLELKRTTVTKGKYNLKWTLWNKAQPSEICCFHTRIELKF